jgi:hypothetical protein
MPAPKTSKRPKARPVDVSPNAERGDSKPMPKKPMRPRERPVDVSPNAERGDAVMKKAGGGMCRGMGAATKGGGYGRMG